MRKLRDSGIWGFAFGYFASYVPYSALTKAVSSGQLGGDPVTGVELLPVSAISSLVGMFLFITLMGWWKHAGQVRLGRLRLPRPGRWTLLSGLCTSAVIATTTLAYTFDGISIVFMMLLMRGGVLALAPIVDRLGGRHVRWFSVAGLALSIGALVIALLGGSDAGFALTWIAGADVMVYLAAYFVRLRWMSKLAKTEDADVRTRYFVEEQMVATPALVAFLIACAAIDHGAFMQSVRAGFTSVLGQPIMVEVIAIGLLSQATGIFGGLILLDGRENTYSVPVNRCSSILAGVAASYVGASWLGGRLPSTSELIAAGVIVLAILCLTVPPLVSAVRRSPRPQRHLARSPRTLRSAHRLLRGGAS